MDSMDKSVSIIMVSLFCTLGIIFALLILSHYKLTRSAIESGYEQVIEDNQVLWKKIKEE